MNPPNDELPFNGLTPEQRYQAATKQTTAVANAFRPFLDLLKTLQLDQLLAAGILHTLGPPPSVDEPEDAHNLRAVQETHLVLDLLAEIAPRDTINAVRADLKRLELRQEPLVLRRDRYVDRRSRDHTEVADRKAAVLLVHYLAAKGGETPRKFLDQLKVGLSFSAFEKWSARVPLEQRMLMTAAGVADEGGVGLSLEQQELLTGSPRCLAVMNRHDAELFPDLAGLSEEDILGKLFDRAQRRRHFARSKQQPPKRMKSSAQPARKPRKKLKKRGRKTLSR